MEIEFIWLTKLGVGPVAVRYSDIITMELTPLCYTRIEFGYGEHLIVEELPAWIFNQIYLVQKLSEQINEANTKEPDKKESDKKE